jgi:hypothetical protein
MKRLVLTLIVLASLMLPLAMAKGITGTNRDPTSSAAHLAY